MEQETIVLSIETSCDETACAVVRNGRHVLADAVYSQIDLHKKFGGVVPEIASRNHLEKISSVVDEALEDSGVSFKDITALAVTHGPGLVGALLVGVSYAKGLAYALDKPLVPVHHIEGHIAANYLTDPTLEPPFLCLVVSGGHSHLVHVKDYTTFQVLGRTRDDAVGEAYDKVARTLGLGYPGGPLLDALAKEGDPKAVSFTRTWLEKGSLDFSFSGIKSGVLNYLNVAAMKGETVVPADVAVGFQEAVVEVLVTKTMEAVRIAGVTTVALAGGVAANSRLREALKQVCEQRGYRLVLPEMRYCTDNAAMIGCAGYYAWKNGRRANFNLNAIPGLQLDWESTQEQKNTR